jgi:hypothetical protein
MKLSEVLRVAREKIEQTDEAFTCVVLRFQCYELDIEDRDRAIEFIGELISPQKTFEDWAVSYGLLDNMMDVAANKRARLAWLLNTIRVLEIKGD